MDLSATVWPLNYFRSGRIFQNGGRRHLGFLKFRNVKGRKGERGCVTVPNFVTIGQTVAEINSRARKLEVLPEKGELGPYLTQCGLDRGLHPCQVSY